MATSADTQIVDAALEYASYGWRVVLLYAPHPKGGCSCAKGRKCKSTGKHPRLDEWQKTASTDEDQIIAWYENWMHSNVGIQFGEASGIIDIECDSEGAERELMLLLGDEAPITPTFQADRGKHRLFRWRKDLPSQAAIHVGNVEFRLGNGNKGAQSVFPPSLHASGKRYTWLLPPSEAEPADIPKGLLAKLWNLAGEDRIEEEHPRSVRHKLYETEGVAEGNRDNVIYAESCALWHEQFVIRGKDCFNDPEAQGVVYKRLWAWNRVQCKPPLDDDVVLKKCEGGRTFIRDQAKRADRTKGPELTSLGLEYRDDEYWPGKWWVEAINSDPPIARLHAPFLPAGHIDLDMESYNSPAKVHLAVLGATGTLCLDDGVRDWKAIWRGGFDKRAKVRRRGLFVKLLDDAQKTEAPEEVKRQNYLAIFVIGYLEKAKVMETDKTPTANQAKWRRADGSLWFSFEALRQQATFDPADKITRNELSQIVREAGAADRVIATTGGRKQFMYFDLEAWAKLQKKGGASEQASIEKNG